ncbi:MAG TPA: HD domain-containing protein [Bryobacteraceae bacterium]|jgi:uncharacterized protein
MSYREKIEQYIREEATPVDKYGHQPRLYALTRQVGNGLDYDDDIVHAAVWMHDLGVFYGHRPSDLRELEKWDSVRYAMNRTPAVLADFGFPTSKIDAVVEAIRTHQPSGDPRTVEGIILRDADILEQLGAIAILRTVSKVGRDTRFTRFTEAIANLKKMLVTLPPMIRLDSTRALAQPKIAALEAFLAAVAAEDQGALE